MIVDGFFYKFTTDPRKDYRFMRDCVIPQWDAVREHVTTIRDAYESVEESTWRAQHLGVLGPSPSESFKIPASVSGISDPAREAVPPSGISDPAREAVPPYHPGSSVPTDGVSSSVHPRRPRGGVTEGDTLQSSM